MAEQLSVVGKGLVQKDGKQRVSGTAVYYSDVRLPGMLHAKMLRSPHAQALIRKIDTHKAEALPGVELVMTYLNYPKAFRPDLHYAGEHVAAVIAKDEDIAEEALDLIEVEYDPQPHVLSLEEALDPGSPEVFAGAPNLHDWELHYYLSDKDPDSGLWQKK